MRENALLNRLMSALALRPDIALRLALWNGMARDLGPRPKVTVRLNGPSAVRFFIPPVWTIWPKDMCKDISMCKAT